MERILLLLSTLLLYYSSSFCQPNFIRNLQNGQPQHIVVYGTSLSSGGNGKAWMDVVSGHLQEQYGEGLFRYSLAGRGGMWSTWGVKNFEDSVIARKPDAVFIEFGINDAFQEYETPVALAKLNLGYMIDRIRLYNDSCDVFIQVMNMPIGKSAALRPHLEDYYAMYRETAKEKKVTLIDHYFNWEAVLEKGEDIFREYVPDGIHPNRKGAEEIIAPKILEVLNLKPMFIPTVQAKQTTKPNFIFFITDDIGWDDIGCYGNPNVKTPNIDRLAKVGLKFENAYLTTSSCSPSRSSIITGRFPHNTGAPELHDPLPEGQGMFPQRLKESGYYTVLSGKNHMGPQTKHAFDTISSGKGPGGEEDWIGMIKNRPKDQPFFFWFASHDAHRDWQVNDKGTLYNPDDIIVPPMLYDGPETRADLASYYHEISRADYYLGEIVAELKRQNILENTYIIFMSDNGRPFPRNKGRLYDSGIKTPFIVWGPDVDQGSTEALISAIDIAPTLLHLAGHEIDEHIQGVSFHPLLKDKEWSDHRDFVFAEHNWHVFQAHERMVRFKDWVYIRNAFPGRQNLVGESTREFPAGKELWDAHEKMLTSPEQEDVFLKPREQEELYYLPDDPYQFKNLISDNKHRESLHYLRKVMDQWIGDTGDSVPEHPTPDRDDVHGRRLPGIWKKGEKAGADRQAERISRKGPVKKNDIR